MKPSRVVIVTGGNSGIGKAVALSFVKSGARVAIFGTNEEKGKNAEEEICIHGGNCCKFYKVDVSKLAEVEVGVKDVCKDMGEVTCVVNNAGITKDNLLIKMSETEWNMVLDVNLKSVYNICRSVVRSMVKNKRGAIINISSVVALRGNAGQVNYSASKAGMIGFTKSLAKELATKNIRVNCIAPGFIITKMTDMLEDDKKQLLLQQIPMKKFGSPEDVASLALFLENDDSSGYITGEVFNVDGGLGI